jgi:hypothetical protein
MRRLWLVLSCAVLVFASSSAAAGKTIDRGIVVRVAPPRFVIRELDGSRRRFRVNRLTEIRLNGRHVRLLRLRRGDVATVDHMGRFVISVTVLRP